MQLYQYVTNKSDDIFVLIFFFVAFEKWSQLACGATELIFGVRTIGKSFDFFLANPRWSWNCKRVNLLLDSVQIIQQECLFLVV